MRYCVEKQSIACMAWITHCYGQLEDSLDLCNADDQLILKNRIFDMLERVKFLLDKKYEPNPKGNTNNPKSIKGATIMKHEYDDARRHAEDTISAVNKALERTRDPSRRHMLTDMHEKATRTLENLRRIQDDRADYRRTNIGYHDDIRQDRYNDDMRRMVDDVMDAVDRVLPYLDDEMDDVVDRRGVPGTGRGRGGRARVRVGGYTRRRARADIYDDYDDMDDTPVAQPRWRSRRTGRFLPDLYGPSRVRRVRRADMDDYYDDDDLMDDHTETVAKVAADTAVRTARRMTDDRYIYPNIPVMPKQDDKTDDATHTPTTRR